MFWTAIGLTAASLTMFGFVPQVIKIARNKSVRDVSVFSLIQFSFGIALWVIYGIYLKNFIIVLANAVSLSSLIIALGLYARYKA
jgi:MtN3 and saliva related transmembrane protein